MRAGNALRLSSINFVIAMLLVVPLTAMTWSQSSYYQDAETLWRATLENNPACWTAHDHLGMIFQQQGRFKEAANQYREALRINPESAEARINLGQLQLDGFEGRLDEAVEQFQAALQIERARRSRTAISVSPGSGWAGLPRGDRRVTRSRPAPAGLRRYSLQPRCGSGRCRVGQRRRRPSSRNAGASSLRWPRGSPKAHRVTGDGLFERRLYPQALREFEQASRLADNADLARAHHEDEAADGARRPTKIRTSRSDAETGAASADHRAVALSDLRLSRERITRSTRRATKSRTSRRDAEAEILASRRDAEAGPGSHNSKAVVLSDLRLTRERITRSARRTTKSRTSRRTRRRRSWPRAETQRQTGLSQIKGGCAE